MGCKSTIVVGGLAVVGIGLGGFAAFQSYMNQPARQVTGAVSEVDLATVAGVTPAEGAEVVELTHIAQGGNTQLFWHCGKVQFGQRHDFEGTFNQLSGAVVYNAEAKLLQALEVKILLESFIGAGSVHPAPPALTNTVISQGWFKIDTHPEAVFSATTFTAKADVAEAPEDAPEGWTHLVEGTFQLNGVEQPLMVPAVVTFSGPSVTVDLGFAFDRKTYQVIEKPLPGTTVDDVVKISATVNASPDSTAVMAQLASLLDAQQKNSAKQTQQIASLESQLSQINDAIAALKRDVEKGLSAAPAVDVSNLPEKIKFTEPLTLQEYEFVLVPGRDGVDPFYIATKEVTWDQYKTWAFGEFADDTATIAKLREADLLPSPPYGDMSAGMGFDDKPAIRMSRINAQQFAAWVGGQVKLGVRLPTEKEWDHAFVTTQGPLDKVPGNVDDIAWHDANADFESQSVGQKDPNAYGIYDLLGNAFEWVTDSEDGERVVRGGSYWTFPEDLKGSLREVEVMDVWNAGYPNEPKSKWWFVDRIDIGIRLIIDATPAVAEFAAE